MPTTAPEAVLKYTRENVVALAYKVRDIKVRGRPQLKVLLEAAGMVLHPERTTSDVAANKSARERFSRWLRHVEEGERWRQLREPEYAKLIAYLFREQLWFSDTVTSRISHLYPDPMFHGVADFIDMDPANIDFIRDNLTGSFAIYRHSLRVPGNVVVGRMDIKWDQATKAIKTREQYRFEPPTVSERTEFNFQGYMFRKHGKYWIISVNLATQAFQMLYINSAEPCGEGRNPKRVDLMSGCVVDVMGPSFYATRFCVTRPFKELGTLKLSAVPADVQTELAREPKKVSDYISVL